MSEGIALAPFALLAAAALAGAVAVALSRDGARAALWLVETAVAVAALCLVMSAEYMAIAHLVVLAGAVPSCAALAMMSAPAVRARRVRPAGAVAFAAALTLALGAAAAGTLPSLDPGGAAPAYPIGVAELGDALFTRWALSVEILAVILLVALVGAALSVEKGRGA